MIHPSKIGSKYMHCMKVLIKNLKLHMLRREAVQPESISQHIMDMLQTVQIIQIYGFWTIFMQIRRL